MGYISSNGNCLITELPAKDIDFENSNSKGYEYEIIVDNITHVLRLPEEAKNWTKDPFFSTNKHIIAGLLMNNNWVENERNQLIEIEFLKAFLNYKSYPKTPKEKQDFFFLKIVNQLSFSGQDISLDYSDSASFRYYFRNKEELLFYCSSLAEMGLIIVKITDQSIEISVTYKGLNHASALQEEGENSDNCFIAMSFGENTKTIREAIKEACNATNYNPILVDEINIESEKTINDAIVANLKRCKFCIADFTEQKDGVYFESGYALGQGKKVIFTCSEAWFNGINGKSHFDTNHFPHIIYKDENELTRKIIDKINAWI
jgi:nucleoside 2-deoxyribosyltransferase